MAKRKRYKGQNRRGMICISAVVLILLSVMFIQSNRLRQKNAAYAAEEQSLRQKIQEESERTEEIEALKDYVHTPEYAGERARENLGLVGEDEIIFKAQD